MAAPYRWQEITPSEFAHEREALDFLRADLPDHDPYFGWSNFEFIADNGAINEVDALVLSSHTLYLVEIKSRPGTLYGDAGTWTWDNGRRRIATDNPLLLANRKAKRLKSLLARQDAYRTSHRAVPFIEAVVFLSAAELDCQLSPDGRHGVCLRRAIADRPGILELLAGDLGPVPVRGQRRLDVDALKTLRRALEQAGIRPSTGSRRVGDYVLERLLAESDQKRFQDWEGHHATLTRQHARIRIYPTAPGAPADERTATLRAAEREFLLTQRIHHPSVARALAFHDLERGPAVVFEHQPGIERLDHFLRTQGSNVSFEMRLRLIRQIAEAMQHAHAQRVVHRALSPQSIYVLPREGAEPLALIADWQLGHREGASTSLHGGAMDVGLLGEMSALVYQAPEVVSGVPADGVKADVYSLGAVAWFILTGQPPAASFPAVRERIQAGPGLRLADVLDGAGHALQALVQDATRPLPLDRPDDVAAFLAHLDAAEHERTAPQPDRPVVHPADAQKEDELLGGIKVQRRLGKGATSVAYSVEREGKRGVLKVASTPEQNARLQGEANVLRELRHPNIVPLQDVLELPGPAGQHTALLLGASGDDETLTQRIRKEGALSLELLGRFGGELLDAVAYLEAQNAVHRDIKPDNITIGENRNKTLTLVLFDFSLATASPTDLHAGTPPYRDPFLPRRRRWDAHAERFAAAVTLHEMATGLTPNWGDADPDLAGGPAKFAIERLDPAVRDDLADFFARAMAPEIRDRFENASAMKREWIRIFEALERPSPGHEAAPSQEGEDDRAWLAALKQASASTALAKLGLNTRLLNAAERLGAHSLGDLLALPKGRLVQSPGIGSRTLRELRQILETVSEQRAVADDIPADAATDPSRWPVDKVAKQIMQIKLDAEVLANLRAALGLDPRVAEPFPTLRDAAEAVGARRVALSEALEEAAARWEKSSWVAALRDDLADAVGQLAGIVTVDQLGQVLLARRGSATIGSLREKEVAAVIAAVVEVEANREAPRFALYRSRRPWIIATDGADERMAFATRLGERADTVAAQDPLPSPARVADELRDVPAPPDDAPWPTERLLAVACQASARAAVSSRMEIYPAGMSATRALRLAAGALIGPSQLDATEIRRRVASRYPDAEPLPDGAVLATMLAEVGLCWTYDPVAGVFRAPVIGAESTTASTTSFMDRGSGDSLDAREFDARLRRVMPEHRFLVATMLSKHVDAVAAAIAARLSFEVVALDALYLAALKAEAAEMEVDWPFILEADSASSETEDHRNLKLLASAAADRMVASLVKREKPMVLRYAGLLARYGCLDRLNRLAAACRARQAPGAVLLVGQADPRGLPHVDRVALPIAEAGDWIAFPPAWLTAEPLAAATS